MRFSYFPGCTDHSTSLEYGLSTHAVFEALGVELVEIEEIVGFTYQPSLEILALMDVILNRIGLEKIREKVKNPLKGLKVACYYGCALVRHPKITQLDDPENPNIWTG